MNGTELLRGSKCGRSNELGSVPTRMFTSSLNQRLQPKKYLQGLGIRILFNALACNELLKKLSWYRKREPTLFSCPPTADPWFRVRSDLGIHRIYLLLHLISSLRKQAHRKFFLIFPPPLRAPAWSLAKSPLLVTTAPTLVWSPLRTLRFWSAESLDELTNHQQATYSFTHTHAHTHTWARTHTQAQKLAHKGQKQKRIPHVNITSSNYRVHQHNGVIVKAQDWRLLLYRNVRMK